MRIALIIEHFDAARGGAERMTVWLAQQLVRRGHHVHVVCHNTSAYINKYRRATMGASWDADRSQQSYPAEQAVADGVHVHKLGGLKINTAIGFTRFGAHASRFCEDHHFDICHSMTVSWPADIYQPHAGIYARIQKQAVASRDGMDSHLKRLFLSLSPKQQTLLLLEKNAFRPLNKGGVRCILSISGMMTRELADVYDISGSRVVELANPRMTDAPDLSLAAEKRAWLRSHLGITEQARVAVFVGHDFRRKGLHWAIETIKKTKQPWYLLVVGLGKTRDYIEQINADGLQERVKMLGPTREVNSVYMAGDALLLPTFYDSFGLVAIEAMAHGLPVISTEFLGAGEIVQRSQAGVIVPTPRDTDAMARALDHLPASGPELDALRQRAIIGAGGMPGDAYVDKIMELYERVKTEKQGQNAER